MVGPVRFRLGIDIGGTFTDFVLVDEESGKTSLYKCLTTPDEPAIGVMDGLATLLEQAGIQGGDIGIAIHGTTLITNALIERRGAKTALLVTEGFRDVLEIGTEVRYDVYDLLLEKPAPLVPRHLRLEVLERLDEQGEIAVPLDVPQLEDAIRRARAAAVEAVAICYLHSFRNPAHERASRDAVRRLLPGATVSISAEVAPEIREYERMTTTVANAYVQPPTTRYLDDLQQRLAQAGYARQLFLMLSSGGITTGETAREFPIRLAESGPAAGVLAAAYFSRWADLDSVISFDMGGTTAKIGVVHRDKPHMTNVMEVARVKRFKKGSGLPIKIPVIELIEIGAGGGSIAHVDRLGLLKVGPQSAGANPGPACYGFGGSKPTVTDANLVLGYLDPGYFLGGAMSLDVEAAGAAITAEIGGPLGLDLVRAARGIYDIVNENMLSAMKVHIAERGEDPRNFYLFAFGGAAPAHAYELARSLRMKGVVVPPGAGTTSALGMVATAVSFEFARSFYTRLDRLAWSDLEAIFRTMETDGARVLREAGVDPRAGHITRLMDMRHKGQGHELSVEIPEAVWTQRSAAEIARVFHSRYRDKYGHAHTDLPVELITCRAVVTGPTPRVPLDARRGDGTPEGALKGRRRVYYGEYGGYTDTPVYDRYRLAAGATFAGPAIVEERECTAVVGPSAQAQVDAYGFLFVHLPDLTEGRR